MFSSLILFFSNLQHLDRPGVSFCSRTTSDGNACSRTTSDGNAITNAVEIYVSSRYIFTACLGGGTVNFQNKPN